MVVYKEEEIMFESIFFAVGVIVSSLICVAVLSVLGNLIKNGFKYPKIIDSHGRRLSILEEKIFKNTVTRF